MASREWDRGRNAMPLIPDRRLPAVCRWLAALSPSSKVEEPLILEVLRPGWDPP